MFLIDYQDKASGGAQFKMTTEAPPVGFGVGAEVNAFSGALGAGWEGFGASGTFLRRSHPKRLSMGFLGGLGASVTFKR